MSVGIYGITRLCGFVRDWQFSAATGGCVGQCNHHCPACSTSGTPVGFVLTKLRSRALKVGNPESTSPRLVRTSDRTAAWTAPLCTRRSASQAEHVTGHLLCILNSADSASANVFSSPVMFFPGSSTSTVTHVLVGDPVTIPDSRSHPRLECGTVHRGIPLPDFPIFAPPTCFFWKFLLQN